MLRRIARVSRLPSVRLSALLALAACSNPPQTKTADAAPTPAAAPAPSAPTPSPTATPPAKAEPTPVAAPVAKPTSSATEGLPAIVVHCDQPAHAIPKSLYGIFFEEINHAGEGGLLAQLLRNPTFEEPGTEQDPLPGWTAQPADAKTKLTPSTAAPVHPSAARHAQLEVGDGGALCNKGHFGVPLRKGDEYVFRAMVKQTAGTLAAADLRVEVLDQFGAAALQASAKVQELGVGNAWREVILRGTASATTAEGELRVWLPGPASYELDTVTLTPSKTWKNHGLRNDLAEKLSLLKPAFVRFPGGCYVEGGDLLADRFQWKTSIGPIDARPGHRNANWGYWSSGLLGYHEYLQLCEDLGAAPMFVVNCGMSHKEVVPMDQLQPWIQDALDAIEYANGDVSTPFGKLRAEHGHPAPFGLRYLEIGNENGMFGSFGGTLAQYSERYEAFRAAIAAKWPDVLTIANTRVKHPMQIVDDHFYMSSGWFWAEADRYAKVDRKGPKVYIGEYAVTHDPGVTGNLRAALGEAAFLFGCERNSDLVTMTSYAPLFVHVKDRKWNPDAIQFDGLRSCGTPSFWMQTMLAEHRPDTLLPTETPVFQQDLTRGSFGLGTWNTHAEYKDITVEHHGDVLYRSDFSKGAGGFRHEAGNWTVVDGALRQDAPGNMQWTWLPNPVLQALADCTIRCKARKISGDEGFLLMFHVAGAGDWTWFNVGGWGNTKHALERSTAGSKIGLGEQVAGKVETGKWHDLRVECKDGEIRCFLDDVLVLQTKDRNPPDFSAVAGRMESGEIVLKVCNGANVPRLTGIDLRGAGAMESAARGLVLTSASLDDENTVDNPRLVAPKNVQVGGVTNNFAYTFPARSLTVLRLLPKPD